MDKNILYINGKRNGYSVEQCGESVTVGELIEWLEQYDSDTQVYISNDNGYTFGNIEWWDVKENDYDFSEW